MIRRSRITKREASHLARMCGTHPDQMGLINDLLIQYLDGLPDSHREQRRLVDVAAQSILVHMRTNARNEDARSKV